MIDSTWQMHRRNDCVRCGLRPFCLELRPGRRSVFWGRSILPPLSWMKRRGRRNYRACVLSDAYTDNLQQKLKDLHGHGNGAFDKAGAKCPVFKHESHGNDLFVSSILRTLPARVRYALSYPGLGWWHPAVPRRCGIEYATVSQHAAAGISRFR